MHWFQSSLAHDWRTNGADLVASCDNADDLARPLFRFSPEAMTAARLQLLSGSRAPAKRPGARRVSPRHQAGHGRHGVAMLRSPFASEPATLAR